MENLNNYFIKKDRQMQKAIFGGNSIKKKRMKLTPRQRLYVWEHPNLYGKKCSICGQRITKMSDMELDHSHPYKSGGTKMNLAHKECNQMNYPALKREVSQTNKMQLQRNPRLRRFNVVGNSLAGCVADAPEEFSRTPEMSVCEMPSEPRMLFQQAESAVTLKQLKSLADTHRSWHLNKKVNVVNSDVKFINLKPFSVSNLPDEEFTIHSDAIELHRIHGIFAFPDKMESILSEGMLGTFQIHFSSPEHSSNYIRNLISRGLGSNPSLANHFKELNFEGGNSSFGFKTEVSLPLM